MNFEQGNIFKLYSLNPSIVGPLKDYIGQKHARCHCMCEFLGRQGCIFLDCIESRLFNIWRDRISVCPLWISAWGAFTAKIAKLPVRDLASKRPLYVLLCILINTPVCVKVAIVARFVITFVEKEF